MHFVLVVIVLVLSSTLILRLCYKNSKSVFTSNKGLDGKTALVTGGTSGIGLEVATDFAKRGAKVIIACPFTEEGEDAKKQIIEKSGSDKVIFKLLDLASFGSVRDFASDILKAEDKLDILVNNAGVGVPNDTKTKDGLTFIMAVNYYGHFLLTLLLLPLLKKAGRSKDPSRVVNMSSITHRIARADIKQFERNMFSWLGLNIINKVQAYATSKLYVALFTRALSKKLSSTNVVVNSADPGFVGTRIYYSAGNIVGRIANILFKTPWEGAQTTIFVALDERAGEVSGEYFVNCRLSSARALVYDDKIAKKIWQESIGFVKLTDGELSNCL